jgi:hypothetical protein
MRRRSLIECVFLILAAAPRAFASGAEEELPLFTDTIRSPLGHYALSIDPNSRTVSVIRSDDRDGVSPQLRMRILNGTASREIALKAVSRPDAPLRYQGHDPNWDGRFSSWVLEYSVDGKGWTRLEPKAKK